VSEPESPKLEEKVAASTAKGSYSFEKSLFPTGSCEHSERLLFLLARPLFPASSWQHGGKLFLQQKHVFLWVAASTAKGPNSYRKASFSYS
jgi:hypothetical protein